MKLFQCRFCFAWIEKGRCSSHYRKMHKKQDLKRIVVIKTKDNLENQPELTECMMCLNKHSTILFPCQHTTSCSNCLMRWWKESFYSPRCPVCRANVQYVVKNGKRNNSLVTRWFRWRRRQLSI